MAIVKLVCQGCGANLDALDTHRVFQCGYCGTTNQITVASSPPAPTPAPGPPPPIQFQPPIQQFGPTPTHASSAGRGLSMFILISTLMPLVIGGAIAYLSFSSSQELLDSVGFGGKPDPSQAQAKPTRTAYWWGSGRPFLADVNGDGVEDIIGATVVIESQTVVLTAISGADSSTLWEQPLGKQAAIPDKLLLRYEPSNRLVLVPTGTALTAYAIETGGRRWVTSFSDAIGEIVLDGDALWVATIDDKHSKVSLADGTISAAETKPSEAAVALLDDEGYSLIPSLRTLDLKSDQFSQLRVEQGFCPKQDLPVGINQASFRDMIPCAHPLGLAFATRDKGTNVPFLVGYDRKTKAERWRAQLTTAGSLETVESGFDQPRAELFGDDAVVSFVPDGKEGVWIRRLSLVDGSTKWETTLNKARGSSKVNGIIVSSDRVLVNYGGNLFVLGFADGVERAVLGGR